MYTRQTIKRRILQAVFLSVTIPLLFAFILPVSAAPGVPTILAYQGRLKSSSGALLGGAGTTYYFKFSLWDAASVGSGSRLWPASAPTNTSANVIQGVFNVNIGDTASGYPDALDYNFSDNQDIYLQVEIATSAGGTYETIGPRQRVTAAGFAINAKTVGGFVPSQIASGSNIPVLSSGNLTLGGTNPQINATSSNNLVIQGGAGTGNVILATNGGRVGVGTASPDYALDIVSTNSALYQSVYGTDDGLVFYAPFDETSGLKSFDHSPLGSDITWSSTAVHTTGKYGNATTFASGGGVYGGVTLASPITFNDFSAEFWINSNSSSCSSICLLFGWNQFGGWSNTFRVFKGSTITFNIRDTAPNDAVLTSNGTFTDGIWHHVALVRTGASMFIYKDGVLDASTTSALIGTNTFGLSSFGIGGRTSSEVNANLDELRIYKRALSQDEIKTQYLRGRTNNVVEGMLRVLDASSTTEFLRVTSAGSVGIGTTAPSSTLHVVGTSQFSATSTFSGNVGIGTATPDEMLTLGNGGKLKFIDSSATYGSTIYNNGYTFTIAGASPNSVASLDILDMITMSTGYSMRGVDNAFKFNKSINAAHNGSYGFETYGSTPGYAAISSVFTDSNTNGLAINSRTGGVDTERIRIESGGNVGIGITDPDYRLDLIHSPGANTFRLGANTTDYIYADAGGAESHIYSAGNRPFKLGANSVTDQLVLAGSGNVGVGTTTPAYKLDVYGNARFGNQTNNLIAGVNCCGTAFVGSQTAGWGFGLTSDGGTTFPLAFDGSTNFNFNSGDVYFDNANNRVGIGTTAPSSSLHVVGNIQGTGGITSGGIISAGTEFRFLGLSYDRIATLDNAGGFGGGYNFNWNNGSAKHDSLGALAGYGYSVDGGVHFYSNSSQAADTAAAERVTITPIGYVGIGTTAPSTTLHVIGDLTAANGVGDQFNVRANSNGYGYSHTYLNGQTQALALYANPQSTSYVVNGITYSTSSSGLISDSDSALALGAGGAEAMRITTAGNVGIGTTAPSALFQSGQTIISDTDAVLSDPAIIASSKYSTAVSGSTPKSVLTLLRTGTGDPTWTYSNIAEFRLSSPTGNGQPRLDLAINNGPTMTNVMSLNYAGNVGIGTTAPGAKLNVVGGTDFQNILLSNVTTDATVKYAGVVSTAYTSANRPVGMVLGYNNDSSNLVDIGGGQAGINAATNIRFWTAANNNTNIGTERMSLNNTGALAVDGDTFNVDATNNRVGIGTTAPSSTLHVVGGVARFDGTDGAGGSLKTGSGIKIGGNNDLLGASSDYGFFAIGSGLDTRFTDYNGANPKMIIKSTGEVGIGTIYPSSTLHLVGAAGTGIIRADAGGSRKISLNVGSGRVGIHFMNEGISHTGISSDGSDLSLGNASVGTDPTNWTDYMTIKAGGNVGIGTIYPSSTLHVVGNITASGTIVLPRGGNISLDGTVARTTSLFYGHVSGGGYPFAGIQTDGPVLTGYAQGTLGTWQTGERQALTWNYLGVDVNGTFNNNGTTTLSTGGGRVGIRTANPTEEIHLAGGVLVGPSSTNDARFTIDNSSGSNHNHFIQNTGASQDAVWMLQRNGSTKWSLGLGYSSSNDFNIGTTENGTNVMVLQGTTGNVGIGTASPSSTLYVASQSSLTAPVFTVRGTCSGGCADLAQFYNQSTKVAYVGESGQIISQSYGEFGKDGGNAGNTFIGRNGGNDAVVLMYPISGAGVRVQLNSNGDSYFTGGNLGVGTSTPDNALTVRGSSATRISVDTGLTNGDSSLILRQQGADKAYLEYIGTTFGGARQNTLEFYTIAGVDQTFLTGSTEKMRILSSNGNVGIGTASPSSTLHVVGDARVTGTIYVADTNSYLAQGRLRLNSSGGAIVENLASQDGSKLTIQTSAGGVNKDIVFAPGEAELLRLTQTGRVGVGITTPSSTLHIKASSGSSSTLRLERPSGSWGLEINAADNNGDIFFDSLVSNAGSGNLIFRTNPGGSAMVEQMRLTGAGKVGIGTSAPSSTLHVVGNIQSSGQVLMANGTSTAPAYSFASNADTGMFLRISGGYPNLAFAALGSEIMRMDQNGSVGIGTAAPTERLSVAKTDSATSTIVDILSTYRGSSQNPAAGWGTGLLFKGDSQAGASFDMARVAAVWETPGCCTREAGLAFYTNKTGTFTEKMRIDNNGNVGIGTTAPSSTLHVIGSMQVGNPTGGDKGAGTINAQAVYDDNTLLTDFVFDKYYDGTVLPEDADLHGEYKMLTIDQMMDFNRTNRHLPTITGREEWNKQGGLSLGKLASQFWESIETQALYIGELNSRIKALELSASSTAPLQGSFQSSAQLPVSDLTVTNLKVTGNLIVQGFATFNADTVGQAEIAPSAMTVRVTFSQSYKNIPIVTVTPVGASALNGNFRYVVNNQDKTGFNIDISSTQALPILFNWHAFASADDAKIFVVDGQPRLVNISIEIAPVQPETTNPIVVNTESSSTTTESVQGGQVAGVTTEQGGESASSTPATTDTASSSPETASSTETIEAPVASSSDSGVITETTPIESVASTPEVITETTPTQ